MKGLNPSITDKTKILLKRIFVKIVVRIDSFNGFFLRQN